MTLQKLVVSCIDSDLVTPMVGVTLAADLRYISKDAKFIFPHVKFGVHPGGALPFFLQKYIGLGRSMEILMRGNDIEAEQALKLGLVTDVYEKEGFKDKCIEDINKICNDNAISIAKTKRIMSILVDDLKNYFDSESRLLM